jgi:hypothetical protein
MVPSRRVIVSAGLVGCCVVVAAGGRAQQTTATPAVGPSAPASSTAERFAGTWDYNPQDSVNAATGRPEQNPRSATQRSPGAAPRGGGGGQGTGQGGGQRDPMPVPPTRAPGDPAGDPAGYRGRGPGTFGPSPLILAEARTLVRDLFEINERLTITVSPEAVTFTDDLGRERTYPTDGKKRKYRLGAASFEARVYWNGPHLKKDIEGAYGFRMSETYFLGDDHRRLFVIIRLGDQTKKPPPPVSGANRVYDRMEEAAQAGAGRSDRRRS